ncbi:hypothetical protein CFter6_1426 [Collimonas fungivorans]|uniref:Transmembrane protein n=1 Tax=Collimonas fungivorans TaxID=158899 RepID=A0A127P916_9BURK|nr:DUF924 family protein [Collimonas fungivorans]AMO94134.1 hypothetical protein CFter6_1426 [Collimonas fungivorans]
MENIQAIREFWFGDSQDDVTAANRQAGLWWGKNPDVDLQIRQRFETTLLAAENNQLADWENTPQGVVALVLLTDQFPRNMYRNTPRSFAFDTLARGFCRKGLQADFYAALRPIERIFLHLPLTHSELLQDQEQAVTLGAALVAQVAASQKECFAGYLSFAIRHRDIIARFGRFPHRNQILQRQSTPAELEFLQQPGSSF